MAPSDSPTGEAFSADTSLAQVPAVFKWLVDEGIWTHGSINLDVGGGKYNVGSDYAAEHGVENLVHDVGNRTKAHNDAVEAWIARRPPSTITISNVLNVIPDADVRLKVLEFARSHAANATVFITVYEGDSKDQLRGSRETSKGWQNFKKTAWYVPEVEQVFPYVERHGKVIVASLKPF